MSITTDMLPVPGAVLFGTVPLIGILIRWQSAITDKPSNSIACCQFCGVHEKNLSTSDPFFKVVCANPSV